MTPAGIETATFRFVAQHLNHCATAVPYICVYIHICTCVCIYIYTHTYIHTGLFEMIVGVLTTFHTQYTWDRSICVCLFNRTKLQVFVTYLIGALYVHPLWFYKHQHDNRVRSKLFVACQRWWFQWRFWFVPSVPGYLREEDEHEPDPWRNPTERKKKYIYSYLKCIMYDKLLKPRQSFRITLYIYSYIRTVHVWTVLGNKCLPRNMR